MERAVAGYSRREPLINTEYAPNGTYCDAVHTLMRDKEARDIERLEAIREIQDPRRKAVMAMALAGLSQRDIASVMAKSQASVSIIFQQKH